MDNDIKPFVRLGGEDGNTFFIIAKCVKAAKKAGWSPVRIEEFINEAMDGDYKHVLQTIIIYFETA
jgi:hypothetical protein